MDRTGDAMSETARRRSTLAAALAVVVAVLLPLAVSSSSAVAKSSRPPVRRATQQTINLVLKQRAFTLPLEPTLGESFVEQADLLDSSAARIGEAGANCGVVKVEPGRSTAVCNLVFQLPRGQLHFSGMIELSGDTLDDQFDLAIVGGTGSYRLARGQAHVAVRVSLTYDVVVKLVR
jgi:hypothetical protein